MFFVFLLSLFFLSFYLNLCCVQLKIVLINMQFVFYEVLGAIALRFTMVLRGTSFVLVIAALSRFNSQSK